MYLNSNAQIRPELSAVVEDAAFADAYFIGLKVFPAYNSAKKTGEFMKITQAASEVQKKNVTDRAQKSPYGKVDRSYEKDNFACQDRGLEEDLDDAVTAELVDFFSTEQVTSKLLLRSIMLDHEARVAAAVFNTGNFAATAAAVAYTEANLATINFALDIQNAVKRVKKRGEAVNTMVLNRDVFDRVRRSTLLSSFLFGPLGGGQQITEEMLGKSFGISTVLVADATVDSSKKGQTAAADYIWPSTYVWVGNVQGGDFAAGGAGRTITWTGDASSLFVTETYRKEDIRSDCVRVRQHTAEKVISTPSGTLVTTSYS
jgi:hypothetical protein